MKYERRAEQEEWKQECSDAFLKYDNVLGQFPCGGGKSFGFASIAKIKDDAGEKTLVVAPQVEIIDQISEKLYDLGIAHGYQAGGYPQIPEARVQVGTPQSILKNLKKGWNGYYDLAIEDECHRAVSKTYLELHDELRRHNRHLYRFGVTASPVRMDNKPMSAAFQYMVPGPQIGELVRLGRLVPLVVKTPPTVDFSGIRNPDASLEKQAALLNNKQFHGTVLQAMQSVGEHLQTLIHATTIAHAKAIAEEVRLAGFTAAVLEGTLSRSERKNIVNDYRRGLIQVLVSIELGITGFDVPGVVHGIWARRTKSMVIWIQGNGRIARISPETGKTRGYVSDLCGNVWNGLGSPDIDREWSLEGGVMVPPALHLVRQCRKCFYWLLRGEKVCTECDTEVSVKQQKFQYAKGGQLVEVKDIKPKQKSQKLQDFKTLERQIDVDDPRAYEKTVALCEDFGYKKAFAAVRLRMRKKFKGMTRKKKGA